MVNQGMHSIVHGLASVASWGAGDFVVVLQQKIDNYLCLCGQKFLYSKKLKY
jgi:hypothetical protein